MTFKKFQTLVAEHRPEVTVWEHGVFGQSNGKVAVVFNKDTEKESKVYFYGGSYLDVLNKLGIPTVDHKWVEELEARLANKIAEHGTITDDCGFSEPYVVDNTEDINYYRSTIEKYRTEYVII